MAWLSEGWGVWPEPEKRFLFSSLSSLEGMASWNGGESLQSSDVTALSEAEAARLEQMDE